MGRTKRSKATPKTPSQFCCSNCDGGLDASDLTYGLVCNACGIRVAGPFSSADEIPDYKPEAT